MKTCMQRFPAPRGGGTVQLFSPLFSGLRATAVNGLVALMALLLVLGGCGQPPPAVSSHLLGGRVCATMGRQVCGSATYYRASVPTYDPVGVYETATSCWWPTRQEASQELQAECNRHSFSWSCVSGLDSFQVEQSTSYYWGAECRARPSSGSVTGCSL